MVLIVGTDQIDRDWVVDQVRERLKSVVALSNDCRLTLINEWVII